MYASIYLKEMVKGGSEISNCRSCGGTFQFFSSQPGIPVKSHIYLVVRRRVSSSPWARLSKKSSQAVKDRFCHSRPCVATLKG